MILHEGLSLPLNYKFCERSFVPPFFPISYAWYIVDAQLINLELLFILKGLLYEVFISELNK